MSARRLAVLVATWLAAGVARADAPDASVTFAHANELYATGAYAEAAEELRALFAATGAVPLLHDEALCREALGKVDAALVLYRAYLAADAEAPDRNAIAEHVKRLERGILQPPGTELRGGLLVETLPEMSLAVDGRAVGRTPWSGFLESGEHHLALTGRELTPMEYKPRVRRGVLVHLAAAASVWHCLCWVEVRTNVVGADLFFDGATESSGRTPWMGSLSPGRHVITARKDGYLPASIDIDYGYGAGAPPSFALVLEKAPIGFLQVMGADGASVDVDGVRVCDVTPCRTPAPMGEHTLEIGLRGRDSFRRRLRIVQTSETRITVDLAPRRPQTVRHVAAGVAVAALAGGGALLLAGDGTAARWGAAGLGGVGLAAAAFAVFYHPASRSSATIESRDISVVPVVGPGLAGLATAGRF